MNVIAGTRFWGQTPDKNRLFAFIERALKVVEDVIVVINTDEDSADTAQTFGMLEHVTMISVSPWGKFAPGLNALCYHAAIKDYSHILLASVEMCFTQEHLHALSRLMDDNTLVAGAALEGHDFKEGKHLHANGRQVPWNTFAIWRLRQIATIGFPPVVDAWFDGGESAGVEEVATIALIQHLYPGTKAKLIALPDINWQINELSDDRFGHHTEKMQTKVSRPAKQLKILGLPGPTVIHIQG